MASLLAVIVVAGGVAILAALVAALVVVIAKVSKATGSAVSKSYEAAVMQEIHHGLGKLDERVESLETLVSDQDRSKESKFDRNLQSE